MQRRPYSIIPFSLQSALRYTSFLPETQKEQPRRDPKSSTKPITHFGRQNTDFQVAPEEEKPLNVTPSVRIMEYPELDGAHKDPTPVVPRVRGSGAYLGGTQARR